MGCGHCAEGGDPFGGFFQWLTEHRECIALSCAHFKRTGRGAAEVDPRIGRLERPHIGVALAYAIELALVIQRRRLRPQPSEQADVLVSTPIAIVLAQEVALALLFLVTGTGNDVQRHSPLGELIEGRNLARCQSRRNRSGPMRDQKFQARRFHCGVQRDVETFGR